jgi:hypothetical protein
MRRGSGSLRMLLLLEGMILLAGGTFHLWAQEKKATVTIDLQEFLDMKKRLDAPSATTVESVLLDGSFRSGAMYLTISGRSSGAPVEAMVLSQTESWALRKCEGNAILKLQNLNLMLLPQGNPYRIRCALQPKKETLFSMTVRNSLDFSNQIEGSETIIRGEQPDIKEVTIIKREAVSSNAKSPVTASARYQVTVTQTTARFSYVLSFYNPNRTKESVTLPLKNGEVVEKVLSSIRYQEEPGSLLFTLNPEENRIEIRGKFPGEKFVPLIDSEQQTLLIESEPVLLLAPETEWRPISPKQSGIRSSFSNAKAFLIDSKSEFSWTVKKLDFFSALGYSVNAANYLFYVPRHGRSIVEASLAITNQGTPEIPLRIPGDILYLEIDSQTQPLLKDAKGNLLLSPGIGEHSILVQYQPQKAVTPFLTSFSAPLVKPDSIVSESAVTLQLGEGWRLGFGSFLQQVAGFVTTSQLVSSLILFFIVWAFFWFLKFKRGLSLCIAIGIFLVSLLRVELAVLTYILLILFAVIRWREAIFRNFSRTMRLMIVGLLVVAVVVLIAILSTIFSINDVPMDRESAYKVSQPAPQHMARSGDALSKVAGLTSNMSEVAGVGGEGANGVAGEMGIMDSQTVEKQSVSYQGIPARVRIPNEGVRHYFRSSLIEAKAPIVLRVLLFRAYIRTFFVLIVIGLMAAVIYRNRLRFREALRVKGANGSESQQIQR